MNGDAPARLAKQHATQRIVGSERAHLGEYRVPRRRQDAADDDVADLPARVTVPTTVMTRRALTARPSAFPGEAGSRTWTVMIT